MSRLVVFAEDAKAQIDEVVAWWTRNRPAAPRLFVEELGAAVELLSSTPEVGSQFTRARRRGVRRILLRRSEQWLYYVYDRRHDVVYVLAVWEPDAEGCRTSCLADGIS